MLADATKADQYFRGALTEQQLYAYWFAAGDVARAHLSLDIANWYYKQLGIPLYQPAQDPTYAANPTDPDTAAVKLASLPVVSDLAGGNSGAGSGSGGSGTAGSGSTGANSGTGAGRATGALTDREAAQQQQAKNALYYGTNPGWVTDYCGWYPEDPMCYANNQLWGGGYGFPGGSETIINNTTIIVNQQGLTLGDVTSRIAGALGNAAAAIAGAVNAVVAGALKGIQHALNTLGNELISAFGTLSRVLGQILKFLEGLLLGIVHGIVKAVQSIGRMLKDVFGHGIVPALQALQKLRDKLIDLYKRFLRPLLIILQDLRKVLAVLKAFHIGWATKLDDALADIQSKLSKPLLYLLGWTNAIANYINLILDARLFIQRPLFLASLNANKGSALNLLINAMNPPANQAAIDAIEAKHTIPTPAESSAAFDQFLKNGSGPLVVPMRSASQLYDFYLSDGSN